MVPLSSFKVFKVSLNAEEAFGFKQAAGANVFYFVL
jgi:hypothetical protein